MKTILLNTLVLLFTASCFAQNVNVKSEEKTTITTIKDSDGEKKIVKSIQTNEAQKVTLGEEKQGNINIPMTDNGPVDVTQTTKVSVDGDLKSIDVDRSAYYTSNGQKYQLKSENSGYSMSTMNNIGNGILRKTSNNNYMYINNEKVSYASYDNVGNLVIETYNPKTDKMETTTYMRMK